MNKDGLRYSLMVYVQPWAHNSRRIKEGPNIDILLMKALPY